MPRIKNISPQALHERLAEFGLDVIKYIYDNDEIYKCEVMDFVKMNGLLEFVESLKKN